VVAFQKRSVQFDIFAVLVLAVAVLVEVDYVVGSAGAVLLHKDLPPFGLVLTSVRENPYVPQTAQSSRFFDID